MADRTVSVRLEAIVDTYNQRMSSAATATEGVGRAGDTAGRKISDALQSAMRTAGQVTVVTAGAGAALLTSALKTGTAYNTLEQTSRAAFKTVLGSQEAAAEMMEKVAAFAKTSPFPRQAFIEGTQQLLAFGMQADKVIPTLSAIQDAMAAAGKGSQEIGEVVNIFAQVQSTGKITADTLNQLGYRGVDAAKLLGDAFGVSANDIRDQISEGTLDAATALDVLTAAMTETFGGAAEGVKDTWVGAVDRVKGAWRDISSIITEPFVTKAGGGLALDWVNAIASGMRDAEKHVTPMMEILTGRLAPAFDLVSNSIQGTRDRIQAWDVQSFIDGLDGLAKYAAPIGGVTAALLAMGANLPILSSLGIAGVNPLVAGLTAMVVLSPELRDVAKTLVDGLRPAGPAFKDLAKQAGDTANTILSSLAPAAGMLVAEFTPLVPVIAQVATGMLASLQTGAETLAPSLTRVVEAIAPVIATLGNTVLQSAAQGFSDVVTKITPEVARLIDAVAPLAGILGADLVSAFGSAMGAIGPLATVVATLVGAVADLPTPVLAAATAFTILSVGPLSGLVTMLGGALVGAVGAARTAVTGMVTSMAASQAVAASMGTQVSRVGALALSARAGVSSLQAAMTSAFISNPVGIAIAGIAGALGYLINKQQTAKALTGSYRETLDGLGNTTMDTTTKINEAFLETGTGFMNSGTDIKDIADRLGVSLETVRHAVMGNETAYNAVVAAGDRYIASSSLIEKATRGRNYEVQDLVNFIGQQSDAVDSAVETEKALIEANEESARAAGVNTDKIKAQTDAVNKNNDAIMAASELFISAREANRRYAETVQTVSEKILENNGVIADANTTEEDRAAALRSSNEELDKLATASLRVLDRNREQGASTAELTQQTADLRQALIDQASQMGMSAEEAAAYVDALGLIPGDYVAKVSVETEVAKATLDSWKSSMTNQFDVPVTPIMDADGKERLVVDFAELGKQNKPVIEVFADGAKARAEAQTTVTAIDQTGTQGRTWIVQADGTLALSKARATETSISSMNPRAFTIDGNGNPARAEGTAVVADINKKSATVTVNAGKSANFDSQVASIRASIPNLFGFPVLTRAAGGPVYGPGTETSDSIPALLSNDEHVWTAREVRAAGGHRSVENLRAAALNQSLPRYAKGGQVQAWEKRVAKGQEPLAASAGSVRTAEPVGQSASPWASAPSPRGVPMAAAQPPVIHVAAPPTDATKVEVTLAMDSAGVMHVVDQRIAAASSTRSASMRAGRPR